MYVFVTGGTGFLGEYLLKELLQRGHEVWCLYRSESRRLDTVRFLSAHGLPGDASKLHWVLGDVLEMDSAWSGWVQAEPGMKRIDSILHSAAATRLHLDENGEPMRTNIGAAKALLGVVEQHPCSVHLISTAYVCGQTSANPVMEVRHPKERFVTVYEESKWEAEELWCGKATLLRPSIIVGDTAMGRCTAFTGWYLFMQAVDMFWRLMVSGDEAAPEFFDFPLDSDGSVNIVPVDYVADATICVVEDPALHGGVYHLTHSNPPTYLEIMEMLLERYGQGEVHFTGDKSMDLKPGTPFEKMWIQQMKTVKRYMGHTPIFDKTNADTIKTRQPLVDMDAAFMNRLIDYAVAKDWGQ